MVVINKVYCIHFMYNMNTYLAYVRNISLLWSSALKLAKKFNSTSFNLKQQVFIRRDEEKTWRGLIYIGEILDTYFGSKSLNCESNLHTFSGGSVIFDQSHIVKADTVADVNLMNRQTFNQVLKSLVCIDFGGKQLNWRSIEQVSSPASPSGRSRYVLSHVCSKIPNIVELG